MLKGKRQGRDIYVWDNGDTYDGNYENDKMNGIGKLISYSLIFTYEGHFANGVFDGQGTYQNENGGWKYEGLFKNGKQEGEGRIYFGKGKSQKGIWENGVLITKTN